MSYFREAIHTGNLQFGSQSGQVYYSMLDVFMKSERETVEFLLERYPVRVPFVSAIFDHLLISAPNIIYFVCLSF